MQVVQIDWNKSRKKFGKLVLSNVEQVAPVGGLVHSQQMTGQWQGTPSRGSIPFW